MTLEGKVKDRIIAYYLRAQGRKEIAFELGMLYLELAERRIARERVAPACIECIRWFSRSGCRIPEYIEELSCWMQRIELKRFLAAARVAVPE